MKQRILFFAIILCFVIIGKHLHAQPSQSPFNLHPPLEGELLLSGTFGEVRTNSFHAGIDFRTGGRSGMRVYASESGYVARIRVSGVGFGKAIYIQHPNGLTTVYAHLDQFSAKIEAFVKNHQYKERSFEVDLHLSPKEFRIERGEFIALSGNSGSSGGPHLHYEVRLTNNQIPLNPAFSNLQIKDTLPPVINSAWLYSINPNKLTNDNNSRIELKVQTRRGKYFVNDTVRVNGTVGLGVKAYDFINKNSLRCGVYGIKLFVNGKLHYHYSADEFNFNETRYANSHIDYALRQTEGKRVHKLFKEPNNLFRGYKSIVNQGHIKIEGDSIYKVRIIAEDAYSNRAELNLVLRGIKENSGIDIPNVTAFNEAHETWLFYKDNSIKTDIFSLSMPRNSLYSNINFTYEILPSQVNMYSPVIKVHNKLTPVHRSYQLSIKADSVPQYLMNKALIGTFSKNNGNGNRNGIDAAGGKYSDGYVIANINYFGDFFIVIDTIAPTITPLNIHNRKNMSKENSIRFKVEDKLSGIAKITGFINNEWALFEHDPKNSLVFYNFDRQKIQRGNTNSLRLQVTDMMGNTSEFSCSFDW